MKRAIIIPVIILLAGLALSFSGCGSSGGLDDVDIEFIAPPALSISDVRLVESTCEQNYYTLSDTYLKGKPCLVLTGKISNTDGSRPVIGMSASGYNDSGEQVAETLDASYLFGTTNWHVEAGEAVEFTIHLNTAEDLSAIEINAGASDKTMP
jgi:hypothetical protein